jgi:hypothetical protein
LLTPSLSVHDTTEGIGSLLGPGENKAAKAKAEREKSSEADVIQFGGCRDDQTSADAHINGKERLEMSNLWLEFSNPATMFCVPYRK